VAPRRPRRPRQPRPPQDDDLYKNDKGFCEEAGYSEPGELLIRIDEFHPAKGFHGYKGNKEAGEKKIINDCFKKGDACVGAILSMVQLG